MPTSLDPATEDGARALRRLDHELVGWLTTLHADGRVQATPIWFLWDGQELLIFSKTRAARNGNIEGHGLVAFNLESGSKGHDVVTAEGEARIVADEPPAWANAAYVAKYQGMFDEYGWTAEWFSEHYSVAIRVRPTRWRLD